MAKSKSKKRPKGGQAGAGKAAQTARPNWGGPAAKGTKAVNVAVAALAVAALVAVGAYFWRNAQVAGDFDALVAEGQAVLERVQTVRNDGGGHLSPGESHVYGTAFPTSGRHSRNTIDPGFYSRPQPPTLLVHSLEHGHIVVYYDEPAAETIETLEDWTSLYTGHWDGVIATPYSGLGETVVLTAWRKILRLDDFDPAAAAAFIDSFRGRGPENPVR